MNGLPDGCVRALQHPRSPTIVEANTKRSFQPRVVLVKIIVWYLG